MDLEDAPLCGACKHHHHQGVKCEICGHVGKCHIYPKMKVRASENRGLKFAFYDSSLVEVNGQWDILCELRRVIYCSEMGIPAEQEFVGPQEAQSRHMIGYAGDAPVAVGRYHVEGVEEGGVIVNIAIVDRMGVLPAYRARGIFGQCLPSLLTDIQKAGASRVIFRVPADSAIKQKAESRGALPVAGLLPETRGERTFVGLALPN